MADTLTSTLATLRFTSASVYSHLCLLIGRILPELRVAEEDLTGKLAIVTGANSGIGLSLATSLARANATVYLACRNVQKGQAAAAKIIDSLTDGSGSSKRVHVVQLDTSSLKSIHAFAEGWREAGRDSDGQARRIDILIHNAGIAGPPAGMEITSDNLGTMYATNHAGPFLLTSLLEQDLASDARVIFTSSTSQFGGDLTYMMSLPRYLPQPGNKTRNLSDEYGDTKAMQCAFARLLQERWQKQASSDGNTRVAHSFSPGFTSTDIFDRMGQLAVFDPIWWTLRATIALATPVEVGAATGFWLASTQDEAVRNPINGGRYWDRLTPFFGTTELALAKYGHGFLERLWELWCLDTGAKWD